MSERLVGLFVLSGLTAGAAFHVPVQSHEVRLCRGLGSETPLPSSMAPVVIPTTSSGPQHVAVDAAGSRRAQVVLEAASLVKAIANVLPIDHEADVRTTRLINEQRANRKTRKLQRKNG